jgi:hypothetical protein
MTDPIDPLEDDEQPDFLKVGDEAPEDAEPIEEPEESPPDDPIPPDDLAPPTPPEG